MEQSCKDSLYKERYSYDANGNIKTVLRNGNLSASLLMDSLTYFYQNGTNKLDYIRDKNAGSTTHNSNYGTSIDIKDQSSANYVYNEIGELNFDRISVIDSIKWNVYGKMQHMYKRTAPGSNATTLHYYYDPSGNRVGKGIQYGSTTSSSNVYTWYVRDAQGNTMAVYQATGSTLSTIPLKLKEHHLYGSSRLGIINRDMDVDQPRLAVDNGNMHLGDAYLATFTRGEKLFELTNHLGNVLLTVTDAKVPTVLAGSSPATVGSYAVNMVTATDYTPFGMVMLGRNYNTVAATKYRYGFNGKEFDNEPKSLGNQIDYGERMYDPRVGRFPSVDPLTNKYPWYTPYQFAGNSPILNVDLDGLEEHPYFLMPKWAKNAYQFFDGLNSAAKSLAHDLAPVRISDENDPKNLREWWNGFKNMPSNLAQLPSEFKEVYTEGSLKQKTEITVKTAGVILAILKGKSAQSKLGIIEYGFKLPKFSLVFRDYFTKGVHVYAGKGEALYFLDEAGEIAVKATGSNLSKKNIIEIVKTGEKALEDKGFRTEMINRIDKSLDLPEVEKFSDGAQKLRDMKKAVEKLGERIEKLAEEKTTTK